MMEIKSPRDPLCLEFMLLFNKPTLKFGAYYEKHFAKQQHNFYTLPSFQNPVPVTKNRFAEKALG